MASQSVTTSQVTIKDLVVALEKEDFDAPKKVYEFSNGRKFYEYGENPYDN